MRTLILPSGLCRLVVAVLGVAHIAVGSPSRAQDSNGKYLIRVYEVQPGDVVTYAKASSGVNSVNLNAGILKKDDTYRNGENTRYAEQVIERPAGAPAPTKSVRTYESAEKTVKNVAQRAAYHGQRVSIEKAGGGYQFLMNGKKLAGPAIEDLEKEFNVKHAQRDFLPPGPVRIGETWTPDLAKILKAVDAENKLVIDPARSTLTAQLANVSKKGGSLVGVIEVRATIVPTQLTMTPGKSFMLNPQSVVRHSVTVELPIDGSPGAESMSSVTSLHLDARMPRGTLLVTGETKGSTTLSIKSK